MISQGTVTDSINHIAFYLSRAMNSLKPRSSWITFVLLFGMLFALDTSVEQAEWVPVPRLGWITLQSMLLASFLASLRKPNAIFIHLIGLVVSILLIQRIGISLISQSESGDLATLLSRITTWIDVAVTGGISDDPLPLTLWMVIACWLISYASTWSVIRHQNIWGGRLPSSIALITALSYLPESFSFYFFMYISFAILLVSWIHGLRAPTRLRTLSSNEILSVSSINFGHSVWVTLILIITANFLPVTTMLVEPLRKGYDQFHQPIETIQEQFNRRFAGTPGKKSTPFQSFGKTLPFKGPLSFQGLMVFTATQSEPTYWGAQIYSEYTPSGWIAPKSTTISVDAKTPQPFTTYATMKTRDHVLKLNFPTTTLFMPGIPTYSDRATTLSITDTSTFRIDLTQATVSPKSYPPDIQLWSQGLLNTTSDSSYNSLKATSIPKLFSQVFPIDTGILQATFVSSNGESSVLEGEIRSPTGSQSATPIKNLITSRLIESSDTLSSIVLYRLPSLNPDIVALRTNKRLSTGDQYAISGKVSTASEAALRASPPTHLSLVTDRYLQVPPATPSRIHALARELTVNHSNQYDKVVALQSFLRKYEYNLTRDKHPHGEDAVDYFLFDSKVGYCDDFASSLAIMARTLGIPSRIVAGYGPGISSPEGDYNIIRDEDSHVWVEIFFQEYGWITFEPTPKYPLPSRISGESSLETINDNLDTDNDMTDISGDEELFDQGNTALVGEFLSRDTNTIGISFTAAILFSLVLILVVSIMLWGTWKRVMRSFGDPSRTYSLMCMLGRVAGVKLLPNMTPFEYANFLAKSIPSARRSIQAVASEYVLLKYAKSNRTSPSIPLLDNALKQFQLAVLAKLFKRRAHLHNQE